MDKVKLNDELIEKVAGGMGGVSAYCPTCQLIFPPNHTTCTFCGSPLISQGQNHGNEENNIAF